MRFPFCFVTIALLSGCMGGENHNSFRSDYGDTPSVVTANPTIQVPELTPGAALPYGVFAKACGISRAQMGQPVAQFPETRPAYTIYDTRPSASTPRTLYLTGFADGCPRQFTGSMAVFGDPQIYEQIHYGAPAGTIKHSKTDTAYDQLKAKVCGVSAHSPCGSKISKLEKNTVFLSVYKNFGSNGDWVNMLVHKGRILAVDENSG